MPQVGFELWYFPDTAEYGESVAATGIVMPLPPDVILYKSVYVPEAQVVAVTPQKASQWLETSEDVRVLRPVHSSDGPPFRSVLVYLPSGGTEVERAGDVRVPSAYRVGAYKASATRLQAVRGDSSYPWAADAEQGRPGFFLTGSSGMSALWRVARVEVDALDRQVVTLAPVRLPHGVIVADFTSVTDPRLRQHLEEHFAAFQRAVTASAHLDVIDRGYNLAEGVLEYSLRVAGRKVPSTLSDRLAEARKVLDAKGSIPLSRYGYTLADKIRHLHSQGHADQVIARGQMVRPEVGMSLTADVSELLRDVALGRY
jgi:hypothetical protein